jgi:hypothetical protein
MVNTANIIISHSSNNPLDYSKGEQWRKSGPCLSSVGAPWNHDFDGMSQGKITQFNI